MNGRRPARVRRGVALALATLLAFAGAGHEAIAQPRASPPPAQVTGDPIAPARAAYERALRRHGPNHAETVVAGFEFATRLAQAGRNADAKPVYLALERSFPAIFPADGPQMARLLSDMAIVWERSGDLVGAYEHARRAVELYRAQPENREPQAVATMLQAARLASEFGRVDEARSALDAGLARLAALPDAGPAMDLTARQTELEIALTLGRTAEAHALLPALERALRTAGRPDPATETSLAHVRILLREGRWQEAQDILDRLSARLDQGEAAQSIPFANTLYYQGFVYLVRSQYVEADAPLRRALAVYEARLGGDHPVVARTLHNLALVYQELGSYAQAESFYRRAIDILGRSFGAQSAAVANTRLESVRLHNAREAYEEAEAEAREGLRILQSVPLPDRRPLAIAHVALGFALQRQGRVAEAIAELEQGLDHIRASRGEEATELSVPQVNLAELYLAQGRGDAALAAIDHALAIMRRDRMAAPTTQARALVTRARILASRDRLDEALALARESSALLQRRGQMAGADAQLGESEQRIARPLYAEHAALAVRAVALRPAGREMLIAESFAAAQGAALSSTAGAISQMAARFSRDAGELADAVRSRQDLMRDLRGLERLATELLAAPPAARPAGREARIATGMAELRDRISALDRDIGSRFPAYRELAQPQPVDLRAVRALLSPDEAVLFQLTTEDASFVWLVAADSVDVVRTDLGRADLDALVRRVRVTIDLTTPEGLRAFDSAAAAEIYRRTLGALGTPLARFRHLVFVLDGPMQSLPPALLLPRVPEPGLAYENLPWLGLSHAISILPTAGSLVVLRSVDRPSQAPEPFIGFGNPLFGGEPGQRRSAAIDLLRTGAPVDRSVFKLIPPLPETAEELEAIRRLLGGKPQHLYLQDRATVGTIKSTKLDQFRVVAFATHALAAGRFPGTAEPAILLAPGSADDPTDDGLLTASEISRLKLDADWVLLSACETAASDGTPSAEGLSGLAQSFIFAGARALLVSHWEVHSAATVPLTTGAIARLAEDRTLAKAEALQRSMAELALGSIDPLYTHPAFWAPFVLVGDGWRRHR